MLKLAKFYLVFCWAFFIWILISQPLPETEVKVFTFYDKVVHFILFGVLTYLLIVAGREIYKRRNFRIIIWLSFAISFFYALLAEYYQTFVPGRTTSEADLAAGSLGIISAVIFFVFKLSRRRPRLLLQVCCAGCGVYISRRLEKDYRTTLYFYNPNIFPAEEHNKRLAEIKKLAGKFGLKLLSIPYAHKFWLEKIKGYEKCPEKGERCLICYRLRLESTARTAREKGFDFFTTTLTVSPYKDAVEIIKIGREMEEKYGVKFLDKDFKKGDGFKKSVQLSRKLGLYRQNYCGCEFSRNT